MPTARAPRRRVGARDRPAHRRGAERAARDRCRRTCPSLLVWTKTDLADRDDVKRLVAAHRGSVAVSATTGDGIDELLGRDRRPAANARARRRVPRPLRPRRRARRAAPRRRGARRGARRRRHARAGAPPRRVGWSLRRVHDAARRHATLSDATGRLDRRCETTDGAGFVPPPYPYERLDALKRVARGVPGGIVDCSIGTPCDPVPDVVIGVPRGRARRVDGLSGIGGQRRTARRGRAAWIARRFDVEVPADGHRRVRRHQGVRRALPHLLRLRDPGARHRPVPGGRVPDLRDGRDPRRLSRRLPSPSTPTGTSISTRSPTRDAERALLLWVNEPGNPTELGRRRRAVPTPSPSWARTRGVVVASDECYVEFAPEPASILQSGHRGRARGAQPVEALEHGRHAVRLLRRRPRARHVPRRDPQARRASWCRHRCRPRAAAALADDEHVTSSARATRSAASSSADGLAAHGLVHDGGPCSFYLWLRDDAGADDGWDDRGPARARRACSCRPAISTARPAPSTCASRSCSRPIGSNSHSTVSTSPRRPVASARRKDSRGRRRRSSRSRSCGRPATRWRDVHARRRGARRSCAAVVGALDRGEIRVAEVVDGRRRRERGRQARGLMWFRVNDMAVVEAGPFEYVDKLPLKRGYLDAGVRVVPGASARFGSYLAPGVVMMPSYVNIGAYVDEGTMVDTWATVGSCAQIGKRVHLSGGVGIGGVLEPPQAAPVVVEDDCFIGSRCMIVDGARVRRGAKVGPGADPHRRRPVIEAETGDEVGRGDIPERAVVVQGTRLREFAGRHVRAPVRADPALPRRGRGARQAPAQRDPARARHRRRERRRAGHELLDLTEQLCAHPVGERQRKARRRLRRAVAARARVARWRSTGSPTTSSPADLGRCRDDARRARRSPRHRARERQPARPAVTGDMLHGLGSADMKGGLAVMLHLAASARPHRAATTSHARLLRR